MVEGEGARNDKFRTQHKIELPVSAKDIMREAIGEMKEHEK